MTKIPDFLPDDFDDQVFIEEDEENDFEDKTDRSRWFLLIIVFILILSLILPTVFLIVRYHRFNHPIPTPVPIEPVYQV